MDNETIKFICCNLIDYNKITTKELLDITFAMLQERGNYQLSTDAWCDLLMAEIAKYSDYKQDNIVEIKGL